MTQQHDQTCSICGALLSSESRYCPRCGAPTSVSFDEVMLSSGKRVSVSQGTLSVRELLGVVEAAVAWWQKQLRDATGVDRENAAAAIKDLSRVLGSLSEQLAQGREVVRITTRLPTLRSYAQICPVCGHGNRTEARYCFACGSPLGEADDLPDVSSVTPVHLHLEVAARSDTGQVRKNNEDTCYAGQLATKDELLATLLLVADGMGGAQAGEAASQLASTTVKDLLVEALNDGLPTDDTAWHAVLRHAATVANQRVFEQAQARADQQGMGTTLSVAVVVGQRVHIAHVGDSRVYLINAAGITDQTTWTQLTSDHTIVARLVDIGQLTTEQARSHPQRNMLYRSIGTDPTVEIDINSHRLRAGDVLLLCTDGLTGHVEDAELAQIVLASSSAAQSSEQLLALANQRGGSDNVSVVLAKAVA